jgi:hypothetical protein
LRWELTDNKISRSGLARTYLIDHPAQARALLARILTLQLDARGECHIARENLDGNQIR